MKSIFHRSVPLLMLIGLILSGCNQYQESPGTGTPATNSPSPPAAPPPPPRPQPLSLYMVPLNPANFSMEAIKKSREKFEENPNDADAHIAYADANFMIQRYDVSLEHYQKALEADKGHLIARLSLSNTFVILQRPDEALEQLEQLLAVQKDHPEALFNKGLILISAKKDQAGSREAWTRLMQVHPEHQLAQRVQRELDSF